MPCRCPVCDPIILWMKKISVKEAAERWPTSNKKLSEPAFATKKTSKAVPRR
jgi:hypothetical protein